MPKKNETKTTATTPSLDDLLADEKTSEDVKSEDTSTDTSEQAPQTFEDAELIALREELTRSKEELAKLQESASRDNTRPVSEGELTPEQKQIRELQDELARTRGRDIANLKEEQELFEGEGVVIHILENGLTAQGRVLYRGQEVVFGPEAYKDTLDRLGQSWLNMTDEEQYARWGKLQFRKGNWPGQRSYEDTNADIRTVASTINI